MAKYIHTLVVSGDTIYLKQRDEAGVGGEWIRDIASTISDSARWVYKVKKQAFITGFPLVEISGRGGAEFEKRMMAEFCQRRSELVLLPTVKENGGEEI